MFNRRRSQPEVPRVLEQQLPELQPIDPHAFILDQEHRLSASARAWGEIANGAQEREDEYRPHILDGLVDVWQANYAEPLPSDEAMNREADKLARELTMYCLLSTRHISGFGGSFPLKDIKSYFLAIPDHTMNYIIRKKGFPTRTFLARQSWRISKMYKADEYASGVLHNLVQTYRQQPDELMAFADLYNDGAAELDDRYRELQNIITVDWHHPDSNKSILRNFLRGLEGRPEVFMPRFVRRVAAAEKEQKYVAIRDMARFAITASGETDPATNEKIAQLLAATYTTWSQFPAIELPFRTYAQRKINELTKALTLIAGARNFKNIRNYPTAEEVDRLKEFFVARHTPSREARRKRDRQDAKAKDPRQLPNAADITQVARDTEPAKPRQMLVAKETTDGYHFDVTNTDQLVAQLRTEVPVNELKIMIEWLKKNPISGASQKLAGRRVKVVHDGKQLPLWRFAPNRAAALNTLSRTSAYTRIVYALTKEEIVIVDVLDHDSFDKKYI